MNYEIVFTKQADDDFEKHKKSGDKIVLKKIGQLLNELRTHPTEGTGKPKLLKHYIEPTWSRRISDKHRLVYRILEEKIIVLVLSNYGHYDDK